MNYIPDDKSEWFVMRDLKRSNAKFPAYKMLEDCGFEVFTPLEWHISKVKGRKEKVLVPVIADLLFVKSTREQLDPIVLKTPTLQYRYGIGNSFRNPMTVPFKEMECFIKIAKSSLSPTYFMPEEITPDMIGKKITVVGGSLDGCEGYLITVRGSKRKRILMGISGLLAVRADVDPEYIRLCNP